MKIIQLSAENIKRLIAVEIKPNGNLVQITGKNGQGKTSVLDSIWWALSGAKHIQTAPIRRGANSAKIKLDMGEIIVTRTFKRTDEGGIDHEAVLDENPSEDLIDYWQERSELFAPPNVIHDRGVE